MDNPELVEEYPRDYELTQFEKIQVAAKRAKDLHNANKTPLVETGRTAPYTALEELKEGVIRTVYREEEPVPMLSRESEESEEE